MRVVIRHDYSTSIHSLPYHIIIMHYAVPSLARVQTQVSMTGTQIIVEWTYVHTGGVAVTAVLVELRNGSSQVYEVAPDGNLTDPSQNMLSIPGEEFLAGVEYQFRVTVTNLFGSSNETVTDEALIGTAGKSHVNVLLVSLALVGVHCKKKRIALTQLRLPELHIKECVCKEVNYIAIDS